MPSAETQLARNYSKDGWHFLIIQKLLESNSAVAGWMLATEIENVLNDLSLSYLLLNRWLDWHWSAFDGHRHDITHCYRSRYVVLHGTTRETPSEKKRRCVTCFLNWPSPIRKEKRRSVRQFHGRSCWVLWSMTIIFSLSFFPLLFQISTSMYISTGPCVSLELGGRLCTYKWPCLYGTGARACFTFLHSWATIKPRLLPPARLASGASSWYRPFASASPSTMPLRWRRLRSCIYIVLLICINNGCWPRKYGCSTYSVGHAQQIFFFI